MFLRGSSGVVVRASKCAVSFPRCRYGASRTATRYSGGCRIPPSKAGLRRSIGSLFRGGTAGPDNNNNSNNERDDHRRRRPKKQTKVVDTLIIGGGPVGLSTAYHLARRRVGGGDDDAATTADPSVLVVERDPSYRSGSAVYSAGGIRMQFSLEENVRMSLYGVDFLRNARSALSTTTSTSSTSSPNRNPVDVGYVENGYLFFATDRAGVDRLRENHESYRKIGCSDMVELLTPAELAIRFPWLNVDDDVLLGSFGREGEGWFDPWSYLRGLNEKSRSMGVSIETGTVVSAERDPATGRVVSVRIRDGSNENELRDVKVNNVVNAAGAAADRVLGLLGGAGGGSSSSYEAADDPTASSSSLVHRLPVRPRKRSMYFFHCAADPEDAAAVVVPDMAPLTIDDATGVYFRSEGAIPGTGNFLCGASPSADEDDPDCYDRRSLDSADPDLFERRIWPALHHRVPAFGSLKLKSSWAGLYEYNTVDRNCVIDFHPEMNNVLMICGFSGHGLQHSPAAGRAGAELIDNRNNEFETLDLSVFRFDRLMEGGGGGSGPVLEKGIY